MREKCISETRVLGVEDWLIMLGKSVGKMYCHSGVLSD